jgi:hypothetical protein
MVVIMVLFLCLNFVMLAVDYDNFLCANLDLDRAISSAQLLPSPLCLVR